MSQAQKDQYCMIPFPWGTQSRQIPRDRKSNGGSQELVGRGTGSYYLMGTVSVWDGNRYWRWSNNITNVLNDLIICLKIVQMVTFVLCMFCIKREKKMVFPLILLIPNCCQPTSGVKQRLTGNVPKRPRRGFATLCTFQVFCSKQAFVPRLGNKGYILKNCLKK